jgi:hypothetical protein
LVAIATCESSPGGLYLHQFTRLSWRSGGDDQIALLRRSGI